MTVYRPIPGSPRLRRGHPLAAGLVGAWFAGPAGAIDLLGGRAVSGGTASVPQVAGPWGRHPQSASDWTTGAVSHPSLQFAGAHTIAALLVLGAPANRAVLGRAASSLFFTTGGGVFRHRLVIGGSNTFLDSGLTIAGGELIAVVAAYDGAEHRMAFDGDVSGSVSRSQSGSLDNPTYVFAPWGPHFTNNSAGGAPGGWYTTQVWDRALSPAEAAAWLADPFTLGRPRTRLYSYAAAPPRRVRTVWS